jgi:hypothetical protein
LQPPILFFLLGLAAVAVRSDLNIPQPIPRILSLLLLIAIGVKGGGQIAAGGLDAHALALIACALGFSVLTPLYSFFVLRRWLSVYDAAAVAAAYGSVSAVTFIIAVNYLQRAAEAYGGHMVAALALMEAPPIVVALLLARHYACDGPRSVRWGTQLHEALCNGSVFVLSGSFVIGLVVGDGGRALLKPLTGDLFPLLLSVFLLDMGLVAGRRVNEAIRNAPVAPLAAVGVPLLNAGLALALAHALGASKGDALLLTVLAASASYIAVPAAMHSALPEANPGLYVSMPLALTFPLNALVGIPVYAWIIERAW